jgi:outer membrane lipoprotein-sorting protein
MMRVLVALILLAAAGGVAGEEAMTVLERSEAVYAGAGSFSADFVQIVETGDFFDDERTEGFLLMQYPNRFVLDTPGQVITCDGDSIWSYSVENKQVVIEAVGKADELITPADYLFNFKENYEIISDTTVFLDSAEVRRIGLKAQSADEFIQLLHLYLAAEDYLVKRVVYTDINANLITVAFSNWQLAVKVEPEKFRFRAPEGVEEVRLP